MFSAKFKVSSMRNLAVLAAMSALVSACASTPPSNTLLTGITDADAAKPASLGASGLRAADDPVCVRFYENSVAFAQAASGPSPVGQFFAATGVSVAAAVLTNGLVGGGGNSVGDIAARSATSQLIFAGSNAALSGLSTSRGPDRKIIAMAGEIGCPVNIG